MMCGNEDLCDNDDEGCDAAAAADDDDDDDDADDVVFCLRYQQYVCYHQLGSDGF